MDTQKEIDDAKTQSFIEIFFEKLGAGAPQIYLNQVNAFQVMGAAAALEVYGKNMFIQELREAEQKKQAQQLSVPTPGIIVPGRE